MRNQFTFYKSFYVAIQKLRKKEDRLSAYEAIAAYALEGKETELTDNADALFVLIKPVLDTAAKKAEGGKIKASNDEDTGKITER